MGPSSYSHRIANLARFLDETRPPGAHTGLPAVSLFSGGGLGDFGYALAGFDFQVFAEREPERLELCKLNHPGAGYIQGDLRYTWRKVVKAYRSRMGKRAPSLLVGMAPCQRMSWSTSWTGRRANPDQVSQDPENRLSLVVAKVAAELKPAAVVVENVGGIFSTTIRDPQTGVEDTVAQILSWKMAGYEPWPAIVQFSDYGVPQRRQRALLTYLRHDVSPCPEENGPYIAATHDRLRRGGRRAWIDARCFLRARAYPRLDSRNRHLSRDPKDPLHWVPNYGKERYELIRAIPPHSGRSAWENGSCQSCGQGSIPPHYAVCTACGAVLYRRPVMRTKNGARLIIGGPTTYKRMPSWLPVGTVTTANGHLGSDAKIHPWENRLLSPRECAEVQTVPRCFRWPDNRGGRPSTRLARSAIGEAIPPWFTFRHGTLVRALLTG